MAVEVADTAHRGASFRARELAGWLTSGLSADAALLPDLEPLSARSEDLVRNHGVAGGAMQTLVDNIVGTGLRLNARPDWRALGRDKSWADEWARQAEALWRGYADTYQIDAARQLTFDAMTRLVCRTAMVSGEAVSLPLWLRGRPGMRWATAHQLVDPARLGNPNDRQDTATLRGGIEQDRYGGPVAYWIRKTHPLDVGGWGRGPAEWERVPAEAAWGRPRVIHVHDKERTGQSRGKPLLSAVLPMFKMADHYERSELQASVVNAMVAAIVESGLNQEELFALFGGSGETYLAERAKWQQPQLKGGSIIPVFPGEKVVPFMPGRPNAQFGDFLTNVFRHIGTQLGLPIELLMKDFSKTNYSSARAALLEAWRFFVSRRAWLTSGWADPVYELWLEEAANAGLIEAPDFYANKAAWCRCEWIVTPGRGWVDPLKEAQAAGERMEVGISTLQRECAEQGSDWEEVLEQRAREIAYRAQLERELGISFPQAARPPAQQPVEVTDA